MRRLLALLLGATLCGAWAGAAAQELGRLFFTLEQRQALDERRKARIPDKPAAVIVESVTTRINGQVLRSGGNSTVFVNGEAIPEGAESGGLNVVPVRADPSGVSIGDSEGGERMRLRVGETLDRGSGEVRDVIGEGSITVKRRGAGGR
jgi:hypothetical protein